MVAGKPLMSGKRKRNPQVNFTCSPEMYRSLEWLAKKMQLRGVPEVARLLITEPLLKKLDEYGFRGEMPEKDHPKEK